MLSDVKSAGLAYLLKFRHRKERNRCSYRSYSTADVHLFILNRVSFLITYSRAYLLLFSTCMHSYTWAYLVINGVSNARMTTRPRRLRLHRDHKFRENLLQRDGERHAALTGQYETSIVAIRFVRVRRRLPEPTRAREQNLEQHHNNGGHDGDRSEDKTTMSPASMERGQKTKNPTSIQ